MKTLLTNLALLNTPLAESAIVGCGVGAALAGARPVVEMQFADFLAPGFNALVNNAAKLHWRWGRPVPLVVRQRPRSATTRCTWNDGYQPADT